MPRHPGSMGNPGAGPAGGGPPGLLMALEAHGASHAAAEAAQRLGEQVRRSSARERREFAALLDAQSGAQIGTIIRGEKGEVNIASLLEAMAPGHDYVLLHTHPGAAPISENDVAIFLEHRALRVMGVVGVRRNWYLLSHMAGHPHPMAPEVLQAYRDAEDALRPHFLGLRQSGRLSGAAAYRELVHEAWGRVASQFGLRYSRVE